MAPSSTSSCTLADWQARGYNVSIVTPSFLASFGPAYLECTEFGPVWRALSQGAAGNDMYPDFFLDPDASLLFRCVGKGGGTADAYRVCVPTQAIRREVLKEMHDAPASEALRIFVKGQPKSWPQKLGMFEFAYNSSQHRTTGYAPFELLYGEVPHTPASLL